MVKEFKDLGTLVEFDCFMQNYGKSVTMVYKAVLFNGQVEQQLTVTNESGEILERYIVDESKHVTPAIIKKMKSLRIKEESQ